MRRYRATPKREVGIEPGWTRANRPTDVPAVHPDTPRESLSPSVAPLPGQLSLLEPEPEPLPIRDGLQWITLPGSTWEDIFYYDGPTLAARVVGNRC